MDDRDREPDRWLQTVTNHLMSYLSGRDLASARAFVNSQLVDEYQKWMTETENQIVGSKQELKNAVIKGGFSKLPQPMKDYISKFAAAVTNGDTQTFVNQQAKVAMNYALGSKSQLTLKVMIL